VTPLDFNRAENGLLSFAKWHNSVYVVDENRMTNVHDETALKSVKVVQTVSGSQTHCPTFGDTL